jgi:asparagine synthase (glutamine-hydrolysing)
VRSRHPLADPQVVECVLSLPPELAFHPRHSRPLLRDAIAGVIPDSVRLRQTKSDFDGPFHAALAGADAEIIAELLGGPDARTRAFVRPQAVARELLAGAPNDLGTRGAWGVQLWRLLTAELWLRALEDPAAVARLRDRALPKAAIRVNRYVRA